MRIRELRTQLGITQSEFAARYSMRSLMGESCFEPDMLKEMLSKNKADLADAEARLASLEVEKDAEAARIRTLSSQIQQIHDWAGEFDSANNDTKKMILARMIEKITVDRHTTSSSASSSRRRALREASPLPMSILTG